ncbi:MAG TPA: hypothetical protein PKD00_03090 [Burkholderiales bacterium]|nr:hypothetical protein [Burkholderiales bacterium]
MKIYITEETKKEIETLIISLEETNTNDEREDGWKNGRLKELQKILFKSTILPEEEAWEDTPMYFSPKMVEAFKKKYPNGIIIKPE